MLSIAPSNPQFQSVNLTASSSSVWSSESTNSVLEATWLTSNTDSLRSISSHSSSSSLPEPALQILAAENVPTLSIQVSGNSLVEGDITSPVAFIISRSGNTTGDLLVHFSVGGTASFAADYTVSGADFASGTTTIPDGVESITVRLTPINDNFAEPIKTIQLTLIADNNYQLSNSAVSSLTIQDDDLHIISDSLVALITGTEMNDLISGTNKDELIEAAEGNDVIDAGAGNDTVYGGAGEDSIDGGLGDDRLYGGDSNDTISGSYGDDLIVGGAGQDLLFGGKGADIFKYESAADFGDTITDFTLLSDRIDLSQLIRNYDGTDLFDRGYVRTRQEGRNTVVEFDFDGNGDNFEHLVTLSRFRARLNSGDFII